MNFLGRRVPFGILRETAILVANVAAADAAAAIDDVDAGKTLISQTRLCVCVCVCVCVLCGSFVTC